MTKFLPDKYMSLNIKKWIVLPLIRYKTLVLDNRIMLLFYNKFEIRMALTISLDITFTPSRRHLQIKLWFKETGEDTRINKSYHITNVV